MNVRTWARAACLSVALASAAVVAVPQLASADTHPAHYSSPYLQLSDSTVGDMAADLAAMIATPADAVEVDVNELVERAVSLARHRLGEEGEILLDLGTLPRIRVDGARLVQAIAHVLLIAADETGPGATCVVTTTADESGGIRIIITHPAVRAPDREPQFWHLVTENIAAARGTVGEARSAAEVVVDVRIPASE